MDQVGLSFGFGSPRKLIFGRGSIERLGEVIEELGLSGKALLVTGRSFARRSGYLEKLKTILESSGMAVSIFDKVEPNPSTETVELGAELARREEVDFIVSFGGGSAMDAGKAIAVLSSQGGRAEDYFYPAVVKPPVLPVIAIPTTCGTGSEVTKFAVISKGLRKDVIVGDVIVPIASILDPDVLSYLPRELLAYTSMDAISHAIESYFNKNANPLSDIYVFGALRTIMRYFKDAYDGSIDARGKLLYASMLAGKAINLCGTAMVHGVGYYLTMRYGFQHGLANALLITQFIRQVSNLVPQRALELGRRLDLNPSTPAESAELLIKALNELKRYSNIPLSLKDAGVPEEDLERIVEGGMSYERNLKNSPGTPTRRDVEELVRGAFKGA
ncbi:MAG: iron-containing alcohol dehydrogenase [Thaumarchaeota archaeon]|nr:iron-containing alcohol dehydrogenase [Nitrososphaerota archaeon]